VVVRWIRMGLELQESLVGLQHDILRNAVELGLPADENVGTFFTFIHS
jgi:hypothetical protein